MALSTGDTLFTLEMLETAGDVFFNSSQDREKAICFYRVGYAHIVEKEGGLSHCVVIALCECQVPVISFFFITVFHLKTFIIIIINHCACLCLKNAFICVFLRTEPFPSQ